MVRRSGCIALAVGLVLVACARVAPVAEVPVAAPTRVVPTASPVAGRGSASPAAADVAATAATAAVVISELDLTAAPDPTALPDVPGLSDAEVASLASLQRVDDYPLYTMHLYGTVGKVSRIREAGLMRVAERSATPARAWACSLFATFGEPGSALYGRNFDWDYSPALLLFFHPQDGYDSVAMVDLAYFFPAGVVSDLDAMPLAARAPLLGVSGWPFDGMNAYGLTVGMAAVPDSDLPHDPRLPTIGSLGLIRAVLDRARDVDEALDVMRRYNVDMCGGPVIHYLIADPSGEAALVEYYDGEMAVLPNANPWHVVTNHYRTPLAVGAPSGCWRYDRLEDRLSVSGGRVSIGEALGLLGEVAQSSTQWSVVYDMARREAHVAMGRAYERVYMVALDAEGE